jgi:hypothetical protein
MLSNADINTGGYSSIFINLIYNQTITPLFGAIMWNYLLISSSAFIISGLIYGGVGLQWTLALRNDLKKA